MTLSLRTLPVGNKAKPSGERSNSASGGSVISLFANRDKAAGSNKKTEVKAEVPILSQWTENRDGTISGIVENDPNGNDGAKITISPTRGGAQAGSIVKATNGSQYRLGLMSEKRQSLLSFAGVFPSFRANDGIATLSDWKQNSDGSITGYVKNKQDFKDGTKITTSPVQKGAKKGSVITTGSGSLYRLL